MRFVTYNIAMAGFAVFLFCLFAVSSAAAQENTATTSDATSTDVEERGTTTAQQETAEEERAVLDERTQNRITNLANNVREVMEAATMRFENIIARMESRTQKLDQQGLETGTARDLIGRAQNALGNAGQTLDSIDVLVEKAVTSEKPRQDFAEVRTRFSTVQSALGQTQGLLRSALATLKNTVAESQSGQNPSDAIESE